MEELDQTAKIKYEISTLTEGAELITCDTRPEYESLCKSMDTAEAMKKQVEEYWNPMVAKAHELHKSLTTKRGDMLKPLETFLQVTKKIGGSFLDLEQKREQARLDAIRAEADRIRREQEGGPGRSVDVAAADPRAAEFLGRNQDRIRAAVLALEQNRRI